MDETLAARMWAHVNAWPGLPVREVRLGALDLRAPGMALVQMAGAVEERRFVDGGFIGRWPFMVVVRVAAGDARGRLWATGVLEALRDWLTEAAPPDLGEGRVALGIEMAAYPEQAAVYPDGTEDWRAVFAMRYRQAAGTRGG